MDTHRLEYFLRVADEGSMTRAATVLGVAQPALSRHIRLLEQDLGVTLFHRTGRGVELTEEGERLRASTAAPLRQLELAMHYAGSPLARIERPLHIGMLPTIAPALSAPFLQGLGVAFPAVTFEIVVAGTDALIEAMLKGTIDTAVMNQVSDERLFSRDLLKEELVVVGGPNSALSPERPLSFTELVDLPLVLPASPIGIRAAVENTALRLKLRIDSPIATDSLHVSLRLVEAGVASCVLPLSACLREIEDGRLRYAPLHEPALTQQVTVASSSQLTLPREFMVKLGEVLRETTAQLVGSGACPAVFLAEREWNPSRW